MILSATNWRLVEARKKTEHRLALVPDDRGQVRQPVHREQTLPVVTRWGNEPAGHVFVIDVRVEPVTAITYDGAIAEGHHNGARSRADFAHRWMRRWPQYRDHHRPDDDEELLAMFAEWHHGDQAWVVKFRPVDGPRLLAPAGRGGEGGLGYTSSERDALPDEPEVIDTDRLHRDWRTRADLHRQAALEPVALSGLTHPEERLAELLRLARERGVDVGSDVRVIERRLAAMQRKITGHGMPQAA